MWQAIISYGEFLNLKWTIAEKYITFTSVTPQYLFWKWTHNSNGLILFKRYCTTGMLTRPEGPRPRPRPRPGPSRPRPRFFVLTSYCFDSHMLRWAATSKNKLLQSTWKHLHYDNGRLLWREVKVMMSILYTCIRYFDIWYLIPKPMQSAI